MSAVVDIEKPRKLFKEAFLFTENTTQKMALYSKSKGKEIALQRGRSLAFYIWLENYDTTIEGVSIKNEKKSGTSLWPNSGKKF
jgi:hypothetical protein